MAGGVRTNPARSTFSCDPCVIERRPRFFTQKPAAPGLLHGKPESRRVENNQQKLHFGRRAPAGTSRSALEQWHRCRTRKEAAHPQLTDQIGPTPTLTRNTPGMDAERRLRKNERPLFTMFPQHRFPFGVTHHNEGF